MPANQAYATVNGDECSWADIAVTINLPGGPQAPLLDIEAIKWSSKVEVGKSGGTSGGRTLKTTAGSATDEAAATLTRDGWQQLIEALETAAIALGQTRGDRVIISGVRFDILVQHTPLGKEGIFMVKLTGCRFLGDSNDMKQGNEADMLEVTLNPMEVARKSKTGNWIVLR